MDGTRSPYAPAAESPSMDPARLRLPTEPAVWLLMLMVVAIIGSFLYVVLSSITY